MLSLLAYVVFLPLILSSPAPTVGVTTEGSMSRNGQYYNPATALKISVRGADVMASPLSLDWSKSDGILAGYQADWIAVTTAPPWMAEDGIICKLPQEQYWYRFAVFIQKVIERYKPEYIEIWNEPDTYYEHMPPDNAYYYGCVGDGCEYGAFIDYLHPRISGRGANIIIGAVASIHSRFILDALDVVGSDYDGISFHCYEYLYTDIAKWCDDKYAYAEQLTGKPVYISETAVFYKVGTEAQYETGQVEHYQRMTELPTVWFWYTLANNGWPAVMPTDLVDSGDPRPVWYEYAQE